MSTVDPARRNSLTNLIRQAHRDLQRAREDGDELSAERNERRMNALLDQLVALSSGRSRWGPYAA